MANNRKNKHDPFVDWFRNSSPYIHAHRGKTVVILFGGEAVAEESFADLIHDISLMHGLGIKLVLVHGARPQIEERLGLHQTEMQYINGLRVTDEAALACVKDATGAVRVEIEARLSMGLANSPMAGVHIRVVSGNFVTAQPIGIRNGIDYGHTGMVRRIDADAIQRVVDAGAIALVPSLGYSPTGEVFNLGAADVASAVAIALGADKLIMLIEGKGVTDTRGKVLTNVIPREVESIMQRRRSLPEELVQQLNCAVKACRGGVKRTHLIGRQMDGALLKELFTRDGVGTLLTAEPYEEIRGARIDDIGGILELLGPLETNGTLVRRSRDLLETEIERFTVVELDGTIIGCASLHPYVEEQIGELAGVAVHPAYRNSGRGDALLAHMERRALSAGINRLFVLTTQTAHWFRERGFIPTQVNTLPLAKQQLYNYQRNSKVFIKGL